MTPRDRLARLHFVNALFHELTGHDLYLADQLLEAIEAAAQEMSVLPPAKALHGYTADLGELLRGLHDRLLGRQPDAGFAFCDGAADRSAGPLFIRAELIAALKRNAPFRQTTIMVGNLPGSASTQPAAAHPRRRRVASKHQREQEHVDTVAQLRDLAARRANPRSLVTLLFV